MVVELVVVVGEIIALIGGFLVVVVFVVVVVMVSVVVAVRVVVLLVGEVTVVFELFWLKLILKTLQ